MGKEKEPDTGCIDSFARSVGGELAYNAGRARGALVFDAVVLAVCFAGFCGNEFAFKSFVAGAFPGSAVAYVAQCHLNDFLGGAAFLAYTNLLFDLVRPDMRIRRIANCLGYILICGFFWEYLAPLVVKPSVADPLDMVAYALGAAAYWMAALPGSRQCEWWMC